VTISSLDLIIEVSGQIVIQYGASNFGEFWGRKSPVDVKASNSGSSIRSRLKSSRITVEFEAHDCDIVNIYPQTSFDALSSRQQGGYEHRL
jgi:hypothetical protein